MDSVRSSKIPIGKMPSTTSQTAMPTQKKTTLTIEVPEDVARAYKEASSSERQRAEEALAASLLNRKEAVRRFREIADRMSAYAAEQGLTPEKLDKLLAEDDDE